MSAIMKLPTLIRARKLLAIIAPASNAAETERAFAQVRLEQLMEETGLRLEDLEEAPRTNRWIIVDSDCIKLAAHIARWIAADNDLHFDVETVITRRKGKRPIEQYRLSVWLSDQEAKDWFPACTYYIDLYKETQAKLKREIADMRRALKELEVGVIHKYKLFGPQTDEEPSTPSPKRVSAIVAAMRATQGHKWNRPAGDLANPTLALESP